MTDLPPGWTWATLDDLQAPEERAITDGPFGSNLTSAHYTVSGARVIRLQNIGDGEFVDERSYISIEHYEALRKHEVREGDLVIASLGENPPRACLVPALDAPAIVKADCIRVRLHPEVDKRWVLHALSAPATKRHAATRIRGVGRPRLGLNEIRKIPLPLPPAAEQRRIVAALEDHFSRMNAGHSLLEAARRRVARLRERVMLLTATGQMNGTAVEGAAPPPAPAGVVDGDLPRIPPTWRWERLGDVADVLGGVTKDSKRQSDPDFVEVPYLRVANVQRGYLDLTDVATIRVAPSKAEALALRPGDVLLNEGGDRDKLGRGWVWEGQIEGCIHQNHVFRARVHNGLLHPKLLAWHANGFGKQWFQANGRQSVNLASISLSKVRLLPVPVPPAGEQESLVKLAEQYLSILDKFEHATCAAFARVRKLRESLLAEAFAGRLVEQDPKGEQAVELLARIRAEASAKPAKKTRSPRTPKQAPAHTTSVTDDDFRQEELPL